MSALTLAMPAPWRGRAAVLARAARSLSVSVGTTALSATVLVVLTLGVGLPAGVANVIAVLCGIAPSYLGNRRFAWRRTGRGSLAREVVPFWVLSIAGLVLSTWSVAHVAALSTGWPAAWRAVALPVANLAVFAALWVVQFVLLDRVIFRARPVSAIAAATVPDARERVAA